MSDTAAEPKPEATEIPVAAEPQPEAVAQPKPRSRTGGFLGTVLGGLIAGGIGYGVGQVWPLVQGTSADLTAIKAEIAALKSAPSDPRIDTLIAQLKEVPKPDTSALEARLQGLETALAAAPATVAAVDAGALKSLQDEVARLKIAPAGSIDTTALQAEADAILTRARTDAEAIAAANRSAAALDRLQAAMDSGAPFGASLADLPEPPAILTDLAATGVPSLTALRASFPDAARVALEAAIQADMGESWTDRALSFLQSTTGARSTTPREGNDPDAVLSRAEAALAAGNLDLSLTEISALPAVAQEAMAGWTATAKTRQDALKAVDELAARQGG
jgi:hypothetical protein